jgi:acetate kinase
MKILVLNCGSSSVKFQLIETTPELIAANQDRLLAHGTVEKIGTDEAIVSCEVTGRAGVKFSREILEHKAAIEAAVGCLTDPSGAVIRHPQEIEGIGHRVVHGGERFTQSALLDEGVVKQLEDLIDLAPLHNPHNLKGYYASRALFPHARHVAVFDTAFHQTLAPHAFLYGLPYVLYERYRIRRYGFHGTSHRYVSYRFAQLHGRTRQDYKLITCHLGNGCSMCAIDHGKSVDTSMGFTPLEGLLMGTRSGDLDPAALLHVMSHEDLEIREASSLLNKHSGLYGVSGVSNDMRTLLAEAAQGHERARLAINMFCYRAKKYLGAYFAAMNGADAVIFTGGIGENAPAVRAQICDGLSAFGIVLDPARNAAALGAEQDLSAAGATTQVWVIPTNEELLIARDTLRALLGIPHP